MDNNTFVFLCVGDTSQATMLTKSIKINSPKAEIIQLSDLTTQKAEGVSAVYRYTFDTLNLMTFRLEAFSALSLNLPAVYLDTDMLLKKDFSISELLLNKDACVCERYFGNGDTINTRYLGLDLSEYAGKTFGEIYPYLACFTITKSHEFWAKCVETIYSLDTKFHKWYGDQEAIRIVCDKKLVDFRTVSEAEVACLPEYTSYAASAYCVHYKGVNRKRIMEQQFLMLSRS